MTPWSHLPMLRLLLPLVAGVSLFVHLKYTINPVQGVLGTSAMLLILILTHSLFQLSYRYRYTWGVVLMGLYILSGYLLAQNYYQINHKRHFSHQSEHYTLMRVQLTEPVCEKPRSYQAIARVTHLISPGAAVKVKGRIIIYFEKDSKATSLKYGDILLIDNGYTPLKKPPNPHMFDYSRYMQWKNVFHQRFCNTHQWMHTGDNNGNPLKAASLRFRDKAYAILQQNNIRDKEYAVACALLLGQRHNMDEEMLQDFSAAGAMHILCVSGLHVGIVYLTLSSLFSFFSFRRKGKLFKTILILAFIWLYAAITGFSPSVLRAATMFSVLAIGENFRRSVNTWNTLAASAVLLILLDPFIIMQVGFQLSYLAVAGIISIQPYLYRKVYFKNYFVTNAWAIITVSMAAQLATAPLTIYYFHQFPNYFLLTNLIVLPLTAIIIKGALLLMLVSPFSILGGIIGNVLSFLLMIMHSTVSHIEQLWGSVTTGLVLQPHEAILMLIIISSATFFIINNARNYLWLSLVAIAILTFSINKRQIKNDYRRQLVVYHVPGATAIDILHRGVCYYYHRGNLTSQHLKYNISPHRLWSGVSSHSDLNKSRQKLPFFYHKGFIGTCDTLFRIIDRDTKLLATYPVPAPHIIISGNPRVHMKDVVECFHPNLVIIDASNTVYNCKRWQQQCDSLNIKCWNISSQGAFMAEL